MSVTYETAEFTAAIRSQRYDEALASLEALLQQHPEALELHWHRVETLERLGRVPELLQALETVLLLEPDHVPAIVKRAQYVAWMAEDEGDADAAENTGRLQLAWRRAEVELRRALALDSSHPDALSALSELLRRSGGDPAACESLLDRAIAAAPGRIDLLERRAGLRRSAALVSDPPDPGDPDLVHTLTGATWSRSRLEAACADLERSLELGGHHRNAMQLAEILHDLGRFDEALARYDQVLARMRIDDPAREAVLAARARSEGGGAGEREELARLIEQAAPDQGGDRTLAEDAARQSMLGAARAVRAGRPVTEALEARISDDPETRLAMMIAQNILNAAHEPDPGLVYVAAEDYPAWQRRFAEQSLAQLEPVGLQYIADAEAAGMFDVLGQHVLLRLHGDESGEIGMATYAIKPKWPGLVAFLVMFLTGKWRVVRMAECVTHFEDGVLLITQWENPSPFEFAGDIRVERMPVTTPLPELYARHCARVAEYRSRHPGVRALQATDLEAFEARWREGQQLKLAYRRSVDYITDAELQKLLGARFERLGPRVREQIAALAADYVEGDGV